VAVSMNLRTIAAWAALAAAAACQANNSIAPGDLVGYYNLSARDGDRVPCCVRTDSQGNLVTVERGELEIEANGKYSFAIYQVLTAGSTLTEEPLVLSSGRWSLDGRTLTLVDSGGLGSVSSALMNGAVAFQIQGHEYEFKRIVPVVVGQYGWLTFDGGLPTCCVSDSAGTRVSVIGGELDIASGTPSGTYQMWLVKRYDSSSGSPMEADVKYASGAYVWDGQTLTLEGAGLTPADSGTSGRAVGSFTGGLLTILTQNHKYQFIRLIQMP